MQVYTALSIPAFRQLKTTQSFGLQDLGEGIEGLYFTEDKAYWVERIKEQDDEAKLEDYQYALLIRFSLPAELIHEIMSDPEVARLSPRMLEYHNAIGKTSHIRPHQPKDEEVLCLLDVYESSETEDGISQAWMLQVSSEEAALWMVFKESIQKIECLGGIPGAMELV
jgi:hypothetical protein